MKNKNNDVAFSGVGLEIKLQKVCLHAEIGGVFKKKNFDLL